MYIDIQTYKTLSRYGGTGIVPFQHSDDAKFIGW